MPQSLSSDLSQKSRAPGLDLLRAVAIVLVVIRHYPRGDDGFWSDWIRQYAWAGVDLFFVLSGYLISKQLFEPIRSGVAINYRAFFIKRFFRILPAYFVVLAIYFVIPAWREQPAIGPFWRFATFTMNLGMDTVNWRAFSHAWSLCVEEQFYLLFPFVIALVCRKKFNPNGIWPVIGALLLLSALLRAHEWQRWIGPVASSSRSLWFIYLKKIYYPTYCRYDALLVGIGIAALQIFWLESWNKLLSRARSITVLALLALSATVIVYRPASEFGWVSATWGTPLLALGFGCLIVLALGPSSAPWARWAYWPATLSYSIYLTHKMAIAAAVRWMHAFRFTKTSAPTVLLAVVLILAAGASLHFLVERPFLKLRRRFLA